jgi:threonine synthase
MSADIKYRSTRGLENGLRFEEVVLGGLAKDGGLYVPERIPQMTIQEIEGVSVTLINDFDMSEL